MGQGQVQPLPHLHASPTGELRIGPSPALCPLHPLQNGPEEAGRQDRIPAGSECQEKLELRLQHRGKAWRKAGARPWRGFLGRTSQQLS